MVQVVTCTQGEKLIQKFVIFQEFNQMYTHVVYWGMICIV